MKKIWYSITKIEKYPEMASQGFFKAIVYLSMLVAILAIVLSIGTVYEINTLVKDGIDYLQNEFPDLTYKDGILKVENEGEIVIPEENTIFGEIIINTNDVDESKQNQYINTIKENGDGILILKDKAIVENASMNTTVEYQYNNIAKSVNITEFNKQSIIDYVNSGKIITTYISVFAILFVYAFILYMIIKVTDVIMISIFGYITSKLAKIKMRYVGIFNMSVYALTLSLLLDILYIAINTFTVFEIKYFQVMYVSVATIYLVAAILMLKTDIREQQIELTKIEEEQKIIKEQMDEEEHKKEEEKEKEERKKKDKKEEDEMPDDPAGSNA